MMTRIRIENDDDGDTLTASFVFYFFVGCSTDLKFSSMDAIVTMNGICIQIS